MSLQLGVIVLPSTKEELAAVLDALAAQFGDTPVITAQGKPAAAAKTPAAKEPAPKKETLKAVSPDQLKSVMTKVRDELGEETLAELLTAFGATKLKEVDKDDWPALVAAGEAALNGGSGDEPSDDDLGLGEDDDLLGGDDDLDGLDEVPDAEEVKTACQAHAKKHGKEKTQAILSKHGLNTVRGLASASDEVLTKIYKAVQ